MPKPGPRTRRGNAASSRNAFKHGIQAGGGVIHGILAGPDNLTAADPRSGGTALGY